MVDAVVPFPHGFGFPLQNPKKLKTLRVLHGFLVVMLKWSLGRYLLSRGPDLEVLFFTWLSGGVRRR